MTEELWSDLRDPDFLRGVVFRHDAQIKQHREDFFVLVERVRRELIDEMRGIKRSLERQDPWQETTAVRQLRTRANAADLAELELHRQRRRSRWLALLSPALAALLYAIAELVRSHVPH
jgi:hypothetical protein